jgi:hypothetical protein
MIFGAARQLTTDATLDLCTTLSLIGYYRGHTAERGPERRWFFLFWLGMALGVLAKGLPGVLIPTATVCVYLLFIRFRPKTVTPQPKAERLRRRLERAAETAAEADTQPGAYSDAGGPDGARRDWSGIRLFVLGFLLFLAVALPWHLFAYRDAGRAFFDEYIVRQHLARFRGGDTSHVAPFWFFIPGFLVGAFPWSFFLPSALAARIHADDGPINADLRVFLKVWAVLVFLMFSASGSKLISYILPMYPPAALLAGDWCARVWEGRSHKRALLLCGGAAFALSGMTLAAIVYSVPLIREIERATHRPVSLDQVPEGAFRWAGHLFAATAVATGGFFLLTAFNRRRAAFGVMGLGMAAFYLFCVFEGLPLIDRALLRPLREIVAPLKDPSSVPSGPLIIKTGGTRRPSVLFYLPDWLVEKQGRSAGVVETRSTDEVVRLMREEFPCLALVDRGSEVEVRRATGASVWNENSSWVVLGPGSKD